MTPQMYLIISLFVFAAAVVMYRMAYAFRAWKFRGAMLVTCPETHKPAAVSVATFRAALNGFLHRQYFELSKCSRWRGRPGCAQQCFKQIQADPKNHRAWNIASKWYAGKKCVYCGKPIDAPSRFDHAPALLRTTDLATVEWKDLPPDQLPAAFSECLPVCWSCHMTETFIRKFPDRVFERPWRH